MNKWGNCKILKPTRCWGHDMRIPAMFKPRLIPHIIKWPFPILHLKPLLINTCEARMSRHIKLGLFPKGASKKLPMGKYFALKTLVTRASLFVANLNAFFLSIARLNPWKWQKPKPPKSFFIVNFSQLSQLIPQWVVFISLTKMNSSFSRVGLLRKLVTRKCSCNKME